MSSSKFLAIGAFALIASSFGAGCAAHEGDPSSTSAPPPDRHASVHAAENGEPIVLDPAAKARFEMTNSDRFTSVVPVRPQTTTANDEKSIKASAHKSGAMLGAHAPVASPLKGGAQ